MKTSLKKWFIVLFLSLGFITSAQQILLDKPVKAGELKLFPELKNESNYYYLPDKPQLALHANKKPQFSFLRYVKNEEKDASKNTAITESDIGGGILHALVELNVTEEMIEEAEQSLRTIDADGKIVGPIMFKSGTVALVSAVSNKDSEFTKQVVGLGSAPVLENQRSAVAVQLNKIGSKLMWESFNTPTPDLSFVFEMEISGYLSPKEVKIEANLERIYKHKSFEGAVATPIFAGEIKAAFDDLYDKGVIKVIQIGDDAQLEKLKEAAYTQILNLIFEKVGGTGVPQLSKLMPSGKKSMLDRATGMLSKARKETAAENSRVEKEQVLRAKLEKKKKTKATTRANKLRESKGLARIKKPTGNQKKASVADANKKKDGGASKKATVAKKQAMPGFAVAVSYQMKQIKRRGVYKVNLKKYTQTTSSQTFTYNVGDVKKKCNTCFREVNLDDDLMKQREVNATLGGVVADDFKYINFVNVLMRKKHQDGSETIDEIKIDRSIFNDKGNFYKMLYGWKGDSDRGKWLNYEYKTLWSVFGDNTFETDWQSTNFGSIALEPPVVKKPVYIEVDEDFVYENGVKAVEIKFYTNLGQKEEIKSVNLKTMKEELSHTMELVLPRESDAYTYVITYFIKGKDPVQSEKKQSDFGRIDIDRF